MTSASEQFFEMVHEDRAVSDPYLIEVTLHYEGDDGSVRYTRELTNDQLAELIVKFDEMADEHE